MIPRKCKRLAEVDFPIAQVSKHAAREKSIRHGHPSTLHMWWARRPLASSRAVLLALLLPDPCDEHCPEAFKRKARQILLGMHGRPQGWTKTIRPDEGLRQIILKFIGDFADWDNAANPAYLDTARALVKTAHGDEPPLIVDPFAGGGSIPLEALRLGCEAFASDLNPVACLILKVMLEDIPRHGPELAEELRKVGGEIKRKAEQELADFYPKDPDGAMPIAYLWARTVRCEAPNCGAEIPLMRSFWLCKKEKRKRALRHRVVQPHGKPPLVEFEVFEPKTEDEVHGATVTRAKATCLCCRKSVLSPDRVRSQLAAQRGGANVIFDAEGNRTVGARMTAVVTLKPGEKGRHYRLPTDADYAAVCKAQARVFEILAEWELGGKHGLCPVPDEPISLNEIRRISVPIYGMTTWGDLFTARQKVALMKLVRFTEEKAALQGSLKNPLVMALDRATDYLSSLCSWHLTGEKVNHTYGRQALPMIWDFTEVNPLSASSGNYTGAIEWGAKVIEELQGITITGQVQPADAANHPLPDQAAGVWFTDPPYYDAVPYAHLADFFLRLAQASNS